MFDSVWLVGAGMACDYCKVLIDLNINFKVIGRSVESAMKFEEKTNKDVFIGGLKALTTFKAPKNIIIAVGGDELFFTLQLVLNQKEIKNILIEKPGTFHRGELLEAQKKAKLNNKKFGLAIIEDSSVKELIKRTEEEGGITSIDLNLQNGVFKLVNLKNVEIKSLPLETQLMLLI